MTGQRLTTIAQGAFCVLFGVVAIGFGDHPITRAQAGVRVDHVPSAVSRPRPAVAPRPVAGRDSTEANRAPSPASVAKRDDAAQRTRVTLRSDDGTVWEVEYEISAGDALGGIADRFDVPVSRIMIANGIRNAHRIRAGARIRIPLEIEALDHAIMAQLPPSLRDNPERLRLAPYFDRWARVYDIDPDLLKALGWIESGWRHNVVSHKGAIGVGQLMPDTVDFVERLIGAELDPWTPEQNIQMAARFLRYLLDETGDVDEALAAYYQGLGALRSQGMYRDTRPYIQNVQAARRYFMAS
jgi:soluble lytic murein transglycosylase-like protein